MTQQRLGRADMHMHTKASDGAPEVEMLLNFVARHRRLDVIAITDHDTLDASLWAYERREHYPFDIVPGMEVSSYEGHILAWWVTEVIPMGMSLEETVIAIHEAGGIAVLAHPFHIHVKESSVGAKRYRKDLDLIQRAGFDAVEAVNAGVIIPGANWYTQVAFADYDVAYVGNSDAHTVRAIGSGTTGFPGRTGDELRHAIETRQTIARGGIWSPVAYASYAYGLMSGSIQWIDLDEKMARKAKERQTPERV